MRGFKHPFHVDTFKTLEAARAAYPHLDPDRFVPAELGDAYNHPTLGIIRDAFPIGAIVQNPDANRQVSHTVDVLKKDGTIVTVAPDNRVLLHVHNDDTKLIDTFELKFDVQGSTYTILLSQFKDGRMTGLHSVRELVENIGDDGDIRKEST